ncbi:DNA-3-methyladenine glycosylase I [Clostridium sp. FP1]|uniref:DNA-3-methyladenine glycosylase I n=2 Tax=unclassified Clostridium TaxID=2614128 RepID=UPI0013E941F2|nr:DNA-3-methyladenine glycosylase I [Clostridium sp. FP1]MBZ9635002.1 DNA-3-methyladenine glycosylase I [Clostridium sp. FP1]
MDRCDWCGNDPLYMKYHDEEWGVPVHEDRKHFEFLILESAQAGLSWITILRKRENYRKAYDDFDFNKIAQYDDEKVIELIQNKGIIRNKLKIAASINNAVMFIKIQEEFGSFDAYIWAFVDNSPIINHWDSIANVPATSELSDKVSKDLKKRGFKFLGSTITYAHLQATGIINDHIKSCFRYTEGATVSN